MIPYTFLSLKEGTPATGYYDHALITDLLSDPMFTKLEENDEGCIVILPGAYQADKIKEINKYLSKFLWVVLIVTSDEESKFPVEKIKHDNIKIYVQYPRQGRHDKYGKFPLGYTTETRKHLYNTEKYVDFFFSGQITHKRREDCVKAIENKEGGQIIKTEGFAQGLKQPAYMLTMCQAKVIPAPTGPESADTFRVYEALEAGAIPIADNVSMSGTGDYWAYLLGGFPFPTINDYSDLPGYIDDQLKDFQTKANKIQAWWIKFKRDLKYRLIEDVAELGGTKYVNEVTVIIPTSVIPSHPDTKIIDETVASVRHHLPDAEIIITFDGLRKEQSDRKADYQEYIRRVLFKCNTSWGNVVPIIFDEFTHQAGMAKVAMNEVKTPTILYVEQDTPLVTDYEIKFCELVDKIRTGESNVIRFSFEAYILEDYKHLMIGEPVDELLKTAQWSQRPHIASTAFYKRILAEHFTDKSRCFIEDLIHGKLQEDFLADGVMGWNQWRVHIFHPEGNIKRSYHTDGRAGEKKFDDKQIW